MTLKSMVVPAGMRLPATSFTVTRTSVVPPAGQVEAGARFVFAAGALSAAQYYDGNISLAGIFYGFVYFFLGFVF